MAIAAGPLVALLSAVPLAVLGAALLWIRPRRPEQVFFGLFAIAWGGQVVGANLGVALDNPAVHARAGLLGYALMPLAALFLTQFAARLHPMRGGTFLSLLHGGVALAAGAVALARPELVIANVGSEGGRLGQVELGPLVAPLFALPFFSAFYTCLLIVYRRYRGARPGTERHRYREMLLALALFTTYQTLANLGISLRLLLRQGGNVAAAPLGYFVLFLVGAAVILVVVAQLLHRPPLPEGRDWVLLAAFLAPAAAAVLDEILTPSGRLVRTWGLWRLLTVAVLVHAIARHQLFDLDLRLKRVAVPAAAALGIGFGALASLARLAGGDALGAASVPIVGATVAASAVVVSRERLEGALFPGVSDDPAYVAARKLEVYRGALEQVLARGEPSADDERVLRRVRRALDISDGDHVRAIAAARTAAGRRPAAVGTVAPGTTVAGRYLVDRALREGGFGRTFLAIDQTNQRQVVVKVVGTTALGGRAAQLLLHEAQLLQKLEHPNVVRFLDVLEAPDAVVLVTDFVDGGDLQGLLQRRGSVPHQEAARLTGQILEGLAALHDRGIVHRDVKPANVLLTRQGTAKLADLGIARSADDAIGITMAGAGTLLYMSPEQVRGESGDARSDVYAAGVILHQLRTGRFYLRIAGRDDFQIRRLILEAEPDVAGIEPAVATVLTRALNKDAMQRYASAAEMRDAVAAALSGGRPA